MFKLLKAYSEATYEIKMFYLMVILYGLAIIASTIYPYLRLDQARSYHAAINEKTS